MHDPLSIPSQATQAATDKARQQIPPQFLSTDGSSFTEPANLLGDNAPPKHIHTLLSNSMTALLDSIAGSLRLAAHMARQNIPKPNQKHGIVPAPPPLWIRPAQQICIEAERLRSTQLLETKSETLSLDIQQRILTHAQTVPFAHPILSKLPLAPPFPLQPFYECASLCTQRLHASGRAFSNGKWSPSPTTSRGNHNTLKQNLEYLKLGGNQNDGIIDGLIGEAPSAAELEPDTEKLTPLQPMVKAFRVNAQALTHIIKKSMMDWTSDKTQGPHAFTFPSIAAASLYETTFRRDGSPTATLFESTTQSESLCSMKLQAWKATVHAAQSLTKRPALPNKINSQVTNTFKNHGDKRFQGKIISILGDEDKESQDATLKTTTAFYIYRIKYDDGDVQDLDAYEIYRLTSLSTQQEHPPQRVCWIPAKLKALIMAAEKAHVRLPKKLTTFLSSPEALISSANSIWVPFTLSHAIWKWACTMETECTHAFEYLPDSISRIHASLKPDLPNPTLLARFMELLKPFQNIEEMITYLKKLNKDSTSGPLGITVTHLLLAGHETHEALLLLTQAAFAGIHASQSKNGEIIPQGEKRKKKLSEIQACGFAGTKS